MLGKKISRNFKEEFQNSWFSLLPPQKRYKTLCLKLKEIKPHTPGEDNDSITTGNIFFLSFNQITADNCCYNIQML